jgi:hypothetical protein
MTSITQKETNTYNKSLKICQVYWGESLFVVKQIYREQESVQKGQRGGRG